MSSVRFQTCLFRLLLALSGLASPALGRSPNVILIVTDDQGYGDVGIHGNAMIETPNLDRLAQQSVRLTNFHVDPTCAETRAAIMTGRYSCRTGVWHTVNGRSLLRPDEKTMADIFAANGYRTGIFGKWHLGDNYPLLPQHRGFDEVLIHGGGGIEQTPDAWGNDYFNDRYFHNGKLEQQSGYCTDVFFRAAMQFIEGSQDKPFFCYLPTNAPHSPFRVPPKYAEPYTKKGVPQPMANFYGMITNIDENLGMLLAKLDEWQITDNTVLIYISDNGTAAGYLPKKANGWTGYNANMRGIKASHYEGGHRVPCFIRWPAGNVGGGREIDSLTAHFDLLPTLIDSCQLLQSATQSTPLDGVSLQPALVNAEQSTKFADRTLVVHSQRVDQPIKWRRCSVMHQQWRLVDGKELYDLSSDPSQTKDLADDQPERVAQLRTHYENWWADVSQRFEETVPIELGSDAAPKVTLTCHDWHAIEGEIPWNQPLVKTDPPANGYWAVQVMRAGRYRFTLRSRPAEVPYSVKQGKARLRFGDQATKTISYAGDAAAVFELELPAGPARLQTWIKDATRPEQGAFYVEVERL